MIIFNEDFSISLPLETVERMTIRPQLLTPLIPKISGSECNGNDLVDQVESKYMLFLDTIMITVGGKEDLSVQMCELRILQNQLKLHKPTERLHNVRYGVITSKSIRILTKDQLDQEMNGKIKETFKELIESTDGDISWLYC